MSVAFPQARRDILDLFLDRWNADTPALNQGIAATVLFQGVEPEAPSDQTRPYASIAVTNVAARQATLADAAGNRVFDRTGLVTVEVRTPLAISQGLYLHDQLCVVARNAFEGEKTASGIWFRNVRIIEQGPEKPFFRSSVFAEFLYDELR